MALLGCQPSRTKNSSRSENAMQAAFCSLKSSSVFLSLCQSRAAHELGLLIMTGAGVPRETTRRFVRRFSIEFGLGVHLLVDNDTWGYFIYSLLLRGAMGPHAHFPWAVPNDVNFIGIRSGDCAEIDLPHDRFRPWEEKWSTRLRALLKIRVFSIERLAG